MKNSQSSFDFSEPVFQPSSYKEALLEQIIRDTAVLREDPVYHVPSTKFYEERIASYRSAALRSNVE